VDLLRARYRRRCHNAACDAAIMRARAPWCTFPERAEAARAAYIGSEWPRAAPVARIGGVEMLFE
jgi:hypothetical protein